MMRPFFQVSLWLALALFVADNGLHGLANTPVLGWLPRAVAGTGFIEDNRQRVEGAMRYYRDGLVSPDDHLCVIVGISNVREGIDLDTVTAAVGKGWHFLGAAGAGLGIGDVAGTATSSCRAAYARILSCWESACTSCWTRGLSPDISSTSECWTICVVGICEMR